MIETIKTANIPEIPGRKEHEHVIDPVAAIIDAARKTYTIDNKLDTDQYCAYLNEILRSKRRTAGILRTESDSMGEGCIVLAESVERECQKLAKEIRNIKKGL
ncbi:MAG: hypothetical protein J6E40_09980 [Lachnospiraceae bacterium]|nr:hypothetical protein [Lachnospiraceae bacterium]